MYVVRNRIYLPPCHMAFLTSSFDFTSHDLPTHTHTHSLSMPFQKEDFVMIQSNRMRKPQSSAFLSGRLSLSTFTHPSTTSITHSQTGQSSSLVRRVSPCDHMTSIITTCPYVQIQYTGTCTSNVTAVQKPISPYVVDIAK